jgi:hypothetical protein
MKYTKEYQEFAKNITDKFISMVTGECPVITDLDSRYLVYPATEEEKINIIKNVMNML